MPHFLVAVPTIFPRIKGPYISSTHFPELISVLSFMIALFRLFQSKQYSKIMSTERPRIQEFSIKLSGRVFELVIGRS